MRSGDLRFSGSHGQSARMALRSRDDEENPHEGGCANLYSSDGESGGRGDDNGLVMTVAVATTMVVAATTTVMAMVVGGGGNGGGSGGDDGGMVQ
ncbi:hypothetical protein E2542_SST15415 [Spatholobus suberectus]|nr:hypothetical protein E2542_SST15415 [Spatholobus suberectus]